MTVYARANIPDPAQWFAKQFSILKTLSPNQFELNERLLDTGGRMRSPEWPSPAYLLIVLFRFSTSYLQRILVHQKSLREKQFPYPFSYATMPRDAPHRQAILHLIPQNSQAGEALSHPDNAPFVSLATHRKRDGSIEQKFGLEIGYHVPARPCPEIIVEVGRNADLILPGSSISKVHFSFEMHPESKEIMFHDRSRYHSTMINPDCFRVDGNFRQVVLRPETKYHIGAGGGKKDLYTFDLWWVRKEGAAEETERGYQMAEERAQNPRWARTVDDGPTELPSWYNTRLHTPSGGGVQRTSEGKELGKGSFGEVKKAVDLDSGRFVAVKKIGLPQKVNGVPSEQETRLYREVKILSSISHVRFQ
jgi:FHA domain